MGYAHLDVHLPNICFTPDGDVCLIDFDRIERLFNSPPVQYSSSFIYTGSPGTTVEQWDWKQFGIIIYCILKLYVISEGIIDNSGKKKKGKDAQLHIEKVIGLLGDKDTVTSPLVDLVLVEEETKEICKERERSKLNLLHWCFTYWKTM